MTKPIKAIPARVAPSHPHEKSDDDDHGSDPNVVQSALALGRRDPRSCRRGGIRRGSRFATPGAMTAINFAKRKLIIVSAPSGLWGERHHGVAVPRGKPMTSAVIHILPDDSLEDWIVQDDDGCKLGHFPTREAAELVAQPLAQKQRGELVIHLPDGRTARQSFTNG
jgi:hypothetical protein